jgi:serine/threonine protein kinase
LNQYQCNHLAQTLQQITKSISGISCRADEFPNNCELLLKELFGIIERAKLLVQECYSEKWWHVALLQVHNEEAFQDLFMDLKSCYGNIYQHLKDQWVGQSDQFRNDVSFPLSTMKELGDKDHRRLVKQLMAIARPIHSSSKNKALEDGELPIAAYLLKRCDTLNQEFLNSGHLVEVDARRGWKKSEFLANGAYGSVEKTTWFGLPCAKKVQSLGDPIEGGDKIFKKEVAILANANHPNVVKFICCGRKLERRKCFIAMELLDTSLEKLIEKVSNCGTSPPFSIGVAMDIILQIAKGMSYLHENKIAHRDLKPANVLVHKIMVDESHKVSYMNVKLADFGLSKIGAHTNNSERLSQGIGTRLYKAPELFEHINQDVNAYQADVYSFGVMCATILSGKQPFEGIDYDFVAKLKSGSRPCVPDDCPRDLVALINKCWSLNRTKRPKFKEICTTLKRLKNSIVLQIQEVENDTTLVKFISNSFLNIMYMFMCIFKRFWKIPNLEGREANVAQHTSQIYTEVLILTLYQMI